MAEWSKALVLGTSLFGGAGSNPASVIFWGISSIGRVRRSQRRGTGIETRILHFYITSTVGLVGYDARLTRERSPVRSRDGVLGRIAQMVERWSNKPSVVGSSPTMTTFLMIRTQSLIMIRSIRGLGSYHNGH